MSINLRKLSDEEQNRISKLKKDLGLGSDAKVIRFLIKHGKVEL